MIDKNETAILWKSELQAQQYETAQAIVGIIELTKSMGLDVQKIAAVVILTAIERACQDTGTNYERQIKEIIKQGED